MSNFYILKDKRVIPVEDVSEWSEFYEDVKNRRVDQTEKDGVRVSTVFLGLDHSFMGDIPLIFETMIFGGEHDDYQDRCSTWKQAEAMHKKACALAFPPKEEITPGEAFPEEKK